MCGQDPGETQVLLQQQYCPGSEQILFRINLRHFVAQHRTDTSAQLTIRRQTFDLPKSYAKMRNNN